MNQIAKRFIVGNSQQSASLPFAEVVLDSAFARLTKESPRFPARAWHHGHGWEFLVSVFGSVAAAKGLHHSDNLPALFEPRSYEWQVYEVGNERIRGDEDVRAGNEYRHKQGCKALEECFEANFVAVVKNREPRKGLTYGVVERRGNSPNASLAYSKLFDLAGRVFDQPIGRVGYDGMNRVRFGILKPAESIALNDARGFCG